jgi:hypothetical protein
MYKLIQKAIGVIMLLTISMIATGGRQIHAAGPVGGGNSYLPVVFGGNGQVNQPANQPMINVPYIAVSDVAGTKLNEMSIFWFGKVFTDTNYTDVRVGYNDEALWIYIASFDKYLWYNETSNGSNLESWDAATLVIHADGATQPTLPSTSSYRFDSQLHWWEGSANYQRAYRGDGTKWVSQNVAFTTVPGWSGTVINDNTEDRGWAMTYKIPFSSLGLTGKPADGTKWRLGVMLHDRDSAAGPALADQVWPAKLDRQSPQTWGGLRFGLPGFSKPTVTNQQTTTIRNKLNGQVVTDGSAGGGALCGEGPNYFELWGNKNFAGEEMFNIQNQVEIADWPCYSKYYVTFPLTSIPAGKAIVSAKLALYEFGGSDPTQAVPSLIQVVQVAQDWDESTLTWNNGPAFVENFARSWVNVFTKNPIVWPGDRYEWDVSRAVALAYQQGIPLRLALYSADSAYHSGKYFTTSDTGDWNATGRPTLIVDWGTPP